MKFGIGLLVCTLICLAMGAILGITGFFMDNQTLLEFGGQTVILGVFLFIGFLGYVIGDGLESPRAEAVYSFPDEIY